MANDRIMGTTPVTDAAAANTRATQSDRAVSDYPAEVPTEISEVEKAKAEKAKKEKEEAAK